MTVNSADYWKLFLETGAPEAYVSYMTTLRMEKDHVFDRSGNRPAGIGLQ